MVNINSDTILMYVLLRKMAVYFCGPFSSPKSCKPSLVMRRTSEKSQKRGILQNSWPLVLKTVKAVKNKESLRNCHNQEKPKENILLDAMWYPGWDPGM